MTINFWEPDDVPKPRDEVKIEKMEATIYRDRFRIRVNLWVTPFLERPSLAVALLDEPQNRVVAEMNIIETMHRKMEFTMHLRGIPGDPAGTYHMKARLYYDQDIAAAYDQGEISIEIPTEEVMVAQDEKGADHASQ